MAWWLVHDLSEEFMEKEKKINDAHNWRSEYIDLASWRLKSLQIELLEHGPKSLSQSWIMQAMYQDWKRIKGYKDPEPPDCSSSLKEWEESIKKYKND
tara:strand:+ start:421 stop:714 length:294 start_codon:yes stop_codon:yes gene_type:complete